MSMLEVANLSLDDPKLEAEIINEDGVDKDHDVNEIWEDSFLLVFHIFFGMENHFPFFIVTLN